MSEWKKVRLGELYVVHNGLSKPRDAFGSGFPFLSYSTVFNNFFLPRSLDSLVQTTEKEQEAYSIKAGDVFITRTSETADELGMSSVALYDYPNATYNGFCKRLRPITDRVYPRYVGYFLRTPVFRSHFNALSGSMTTRASLKNEDLLAMEISLPPLPTQRKIAAVLGALDDKIENNRKICANLEAQAQAIFKSWFVDFEPFGGKMPQGWKITSIYDFAEIIYGAPFKSNLFNEKAIGRPIIRIRDLKNNETKTFTTEHHDKEYLVQPGDLVVGMDGEFRPYIWGNYPALLNQRVCVFKPLDNVSTAFLYCTIKPQLALVEATEAATTVIHIGKEDFDSFKILLPSERWLGKFNDVAQNAFAAMTKYRLESHALAATRDALLPKLMSGEIDVEKVKVA